jgi:cytochrome d ubiquinol oxidase subunit I
VIGLAPAMLALFFSLHITMVNLGIGLAWLVPYLKWRADRGERELEPVARSLMRFYAATYGVAGVFGTAFTVFLLSYYPKFLGFAGDITMVPFGIAILMIILHFFSISAFWYGWDRWSRKAHYAIGLLLGVSALLIPLGFRAVFAFLNIPAGLGYDPAHHKFYLDVAAAIAKNPTYLPLYIKSIVAAFTATFVVVLGAYAYRYHAASSEEERKIALRIVRMMAPAAAAGLALMFVLGLWYALSLRAIPYKFNNVFASLGWKVAYGKAYFDVSWLFVVKMLLYLVQIAAVAYAFKLARIGFTGGAAKFMVFAGAAAIFAIAAGELLNAFSQYPFFVAVWPDILTGHVPLSKLASYGIHIPASSLNDVVSTVNSIVVLDNSGSARRIIEGLGLSKAFPQLSPVNEIAVTTPVVAITFAFLAFLLAAATYFVFRVLLFPGVKIAYAEEAEAAG